MPRPSPLAARQPPTPAEVWRLVDRRTGRTLGTRRYPTLADAARARVSLVRIAAEVMSREGAADVARRADVRRELATMTFTLED